MEGNAARWKWQRGPTLGSLATTRLCRLRCRYCVASFSTPPVPNRIRISVTFVGAQSFFGHGFFDAGGLQRGSRNDTGTAYFEDWAKSGSA